MLSADEVRLTNQTDYRKVAQAAAQLIADAVEIMTPEQVGQWRGVRTWQERFEEVESDLERQRYGPAHL